jgi:hypothetical protein
VRNDAEIADEVGLQERGRRVECLWLIERCGGPKLTGPISLSKTPPP